MQSKNLDFLGISKNPSLVNNEKIFLSTAITKYNDYGLRQGRSLVVTDKAVYNLKKNKVQRRIPLEKLEAMSLSTQSSEFVLHVKGEYDYRLLSFERRKDIVETILNVICRVRQIALSYPLYYVPKINLYSVMTTHSAFKKRKVIRPHKDYMKIMNLEKFQDADKTDTARRTELRERTTLLFNKSKKDKKDLCLDDFELLKVLGKGAFGKVMLAQKKDNERVYAIKVLKKNDVIEMDQLEHTKAEKLILQHINHPFLVNLEFAFQTPEKLYFVMEFMAGGELFTHLRNQKKFSEEQARFYAACITLGLGHLHNKNYIYRDLKLENLLLDEEGFAKLTDFGLAKFITAEEKALTFCGTPEYLAPEVIRGKGHNRPADWWSLGILIYEMIYGIPPFYSNVTQNIYRKACRDKPVFKNTVKVSEECKDLILKLLAKKPEQRLGTEADVLEIMDHPWFAGLDWSLLREKKLKPPFVPDVKGDDWVKNFDEEFTSEIVRDTNIRVDLESLKKFQDEFKEMDFKGN